MKRLGCPACGRKVNILNGHYEYHRPPDAMAEDPDCPHSGERYGCKCTGKKRNPTCRWEGHQHEVGCERDTDGDGDCPVHPAGCPLKETGFFQEGHYVNHGPTPGLVCPTCGTTRREATEHSLGIRAFSAMNRARCTASNGFNHKLGSWSFSDWMTALVGEIGEAANVIKKLNRIRDGIPGNKEKQFELETRLRQELADAYIYLDLIMQAAGYDTEDAVLKTFHAKSMEIGYTPKGE